MASFKKLMQVFTTSFALGLLLALIGFQWFWLEMRFNVGLLIPIVMAGSLICYFVPFGRRYLNKTTGGKIFIAIYLTIIALLASKYGLPGSQVIPAAILRELLSISGYGLVQYNQIILMMFFLGLSSFYLKLGVSSGLIWLLLSQIELTKITDSLAGISWGYLHIALLLALLAMPFSAIKWQPLLKAQGVEHSLKKLTGIYFVGLFFNNFLPSSIGGDVVRIYKAGKDMNEYEKAAASVLMERLLATIGLVLVALIALIVSFAMGEYLLMPALVVGSIGVVMAVVLVGAFYWLPDKGREQGENRFWLAKFYRVTQAIKQYRGKRKLLARVIWLSALFQLIVVVLNYFIFLALGHSVSLLSCALYIPIISALAMVPFSINGLGVREGAYVYFFAQIGIDAALAVTASLLFFVIVIAASVPGGVLFAFAGERRVDYLESTVTITGK